MNDNLYDHDYVQGFAESRLRPRMSNLLYEEPAEESRLHLWTHCVWAVRWDTKAEVSLFLMNRVFFCL